ncbi:helix-turn-helix domain-containing protein [Escherichia sp. MAL-1]
MNDFQGHHNEFEIARHFRLPPEDVIADSGGCGWLNIFALVHRQPLYANECHRPATTQHQLVLYRGGPESGEVSFNQEPWRKYTKRNNEWYIAPAGGTGSSWRWNSRSCVQRDSQICRILLPAKVLEVDAQSHDVGTPVTLTPRMGVVDDFMLKLALELQTEMAAPSLLGRPYGDAIAALLSLHILKHYAGVNTVELPTGVVFSSAKKTAIQDYILAHLHTELSLDGMASAASLSKFHFSRIFKNTFGMPPYKYLFFTRMQLLERLLVETDEPLYLLSEKVGFRYSNNLVRAFRRFKGVTPSQYRHKQKNRPKGR